MAKVAPAVLTITSFTIVFLIGFWVFVMPELKSAGSHRAQLEAESSTAVPSQEKQPVSLGAADVLATQKQVLGLLPDTDRQYDLAVQIEALSKSLNVPLTNLSLSSGPSVSFGPKTSVAASASPAAGEDGAATAPKPSASPAAPASSAQKLTVNLSITAPSYQDLQRFVTGLTSLERFVQIDQLNVTASATGGDQLTAQIVAFAYYVSGPKAAATPTPAATPTK